MRVLITIYKLSIFILFEKARNSSFTLVSFSQMCILTTDINLIKQWKKDSECFCHQIEGLKVSTLKMTAALFSFKDLFIYLRECTCTCLHMSGAWGARKRESQADSPLNMEPNAGLDAMTLRLWPKLKSRVRCECSIISICFLNWVICSLKRRPQDQALVIFGDYLFI